MQSHNKNKFILIFLTIFLYGKAPLRAIESQAEQVASPVVVFAQGLGTSVEASKLKLIDQLFPTFISHGKNPPEVIEHFNKPVKKMFGKPLHRNTCHGQQKDIDQVIIACEEVLQKNKSADIIAFGFSKGGSTWLNTLGFLSISSDPNHKNILNHIKAVIVIGSFIDLFKAGVLTALLGSWAPFAQRFTPSDFCGIGRTISGSISKLFFPAYNAHGIHPLTMIPHIVPDIPLLIAHSQDDELVSINHGREIYKALINSKKRKDKKNTYLYEFKGRGHTKLYEELHLIHNHIHTFLDTYGLTTHYKQPPIKINMSELQPSIAEINAKISQNTIVPSVAYGLIFATSLKTSFTLYNYLRNKFSATNSNKQQNTPIEHQISLTKSLLYGSGVALGSEAINLYRSTILNKKKTKK